MTDWNQNGKHDITDSYIDYKIYKDMSSGNTSMGTFFLVMLMFLICCIYGISADRLLRESNPQETV